MAINGDYVFSAALTAELKDEIKRRSETQLAEMLGVDADMNTMAEFVGVLIGNKKSMAQIASDLVDFIGDENAQQFVAWLSDMLPTLEGPSEDASAEDDADSLAPPSLGGDDAEQQPKRVISLKSVTSSESAPQKKVISLSGGGGTVRSLNRDSKEMSEVLARRSQRFGIPEKPATTQQPKNSKADNDNSNDARGAKRKAEANDTQQKRPGSGGARLAQLLGPPVNVDQAELDARDSLQSNKRKKTGRGDERDNRGTRNEQENQRNSDGNGRRQNRRRQDNDDKDDAQPPLPPGSPRDRDRSGRSDRGGRDDRDGRDRRDGRDGRDTRGGRSDPRDFHHQGGFRGPPGYGGFAPPPYGHPMGYFPPPYGMPPYGMGFPPQGMPPGPYMQPPMPPGPPKQHYQPRGAPRPFMNKKWVNPNTVKPEGETLADGASAEEGASEVAPAGGAGAPTMNQNAQQFMPRNPYYNAQMRPRFQNKTWVRADPANEEEFSSSLPQTPPREESEAAE